MKSYLKPEAIFSEYSYIKEKICADFAETSVNNWGDYEYTDPDYTDE